MEFHVSRAARDRYEFDEALFTLSGNVILPDFAATRRFADRMNRQRDLVKHPDQAVNAGELNAMGLIDEILHFVVRMYREQVNPGVFGQSLESLSGTLGREQLERVLRTFADTFPTVAVYRGRVGLDEWLAGETGGVAHREIVLEELMMLWLANVNPAFGPFRELFDDTALARDTAYSDIVTQLPAFFANQPGFGGEGMSLVDLLRSVALAAPDSLSGQLRYIRERWGLLLGSYLDRLVLSLDVLKEEERARFLRFTRPVVTPHADVYEFHGLDHEAERFSTDLDWMPRVVLLAKSAYVWLDQLSKQYGRAVTRLDEIPDEELDQLERWGMTGLWLIGLWERSRSSQRIKQMCGNPEAAASAYSLYDYCIAADLGGDAALENLRGRAARRGIRLASDMVPNHMGIDSRWVIEHPDWFLSLDYSPFPSYRFEGPELSGDPRVGVHLEDHYYDRSDAAVVFKRIDHHTGATRYIYHGNDGTSMPWNDTAQLDYLKPEVREGVIQTILHVARQFPIIRFDAAMTLAKKHIQRLWYPEPGTGGAIPSRAEHGLTRAQLDRHMPEEFWREVVDRVAAEAPDTLLLAEAFWLMEGYFVRTLGMHRVYNSAFMNMLRDEENSKYRSVIKNTMEFDPEILKRYVNFMNNPDERTAVDQFGKGDKYLGICTLMVTLPGLPMFGHGQVEGLAERYGMEYRRAYAADPPDQDLIARHERTIFPLVHRRRLFAEVRDFLLYDFYNESGHVNEDVFAYSNRMGDERALVLFHNRYAEARGWVKTSAAYAVKTEGGKQLRQRSVAEGLGLPDYPGALLRFRDVASGLEYLRYAGEIRDRGFFADLKAYDRRVLLDWAEVPRDGERPWIQLAGELGGGGVPSLEEALLAIELRPVHEVVRALLEPMRIGQLRQAAIAGAVGPEGKGAAEHADRPAEAAGSRRGTRGAASASQRAPAAKTKTAARTQAPDAVRLMAEIGEQARRLLVEARRLSSGTPEAPAVLDWNGDDEEAARGLGARIEAALSLPALERRFPEPWTPEARAVLPSRNPDLRAADAPWAVTLAWAVVEALGQVADPRSPDRGASLVLETLRLRPLFASLFHDFGLEGEEAWRAVARIRLRFAHPEWHRAEEAQEAAVPTQAEADGETAPADAAPTDSPRRAWLYDPEVQWLIGANEHEGVLWFQRESYLGLVWWMSLGDLLEIAGRTPPDTARLEIAAGRLAELREEAEASGYRVDRLISPRVRVESSGRTV